MPRSEPILWPPVFPGAEDVAKSPLLEPNEDLAPRNASGAELAGGRKTKKEMTSRFGGRYEKRLPSHLLVERRLRLTFFRPDSPVRTGALPGFSGSLDLIRAKPARRPLSWQISCS